MNSISRTFQTSSKLTGSPERLFGRGSSFLATSKSCMIKRLRKITLKGEKGFGIWLMCML